VGVRLQSRLGARDHALHALTLARGDTGFEETLVDAEPSGQPLDRLARRAGLSALDLADVLLREALAGELGLRQALRDAQLAHAIPEGRTKGRCGRG